MNKINVCVFGIKPTVNEGKWVPTHAFYYKDPVSSKENLVPTTSILFVGKMASYHQDKVDCQFNFIFRPLDSKCWIPIEGENTEFECTALNQEEVTNFYHGFYKEIEIEHTKGWGFWKFRITKFQNFENPIFLCWWFDPCGNSNHQIILSRLQEKIGAKLRKPNLLKKLEKEGLESAIEPLKYFSENILGRKDNQWFINLLKFKSNKTTYLVTNNPEKFNFFPY